MVRKGGAVIDVLELHTQRRRSTKVSEQHQFSQEQRRKAKELVQRAKSDSTFMRRLRDDPESVLKEFGLPTDADTVSELSPPGSDLAAIPPCGLGTCKVTLVSPEEEWAE
jgi:hypothetical protein